MWPETVITISVPVTAEQLAIIDREPDVLRKVEHDVGQALAESFDAWLRRELAADSGPKSRGLFHAP